MTADKRNTIRTVFVLLMSAFAVAVGAVLLFVEAVSKSTLCSIFCIGLLVYGIIRIARFFAGQGLTNPGNYGFAIGVLSVVLGCVGLIKAGTIAENLDGWLGICALCISIIMLQESLRLRVLGSIVWLVDIILTGIIMAAAVIVMVEAPFIAKLFPRMAEWTVLVAGILNLINYPVVLFTIKNKVKKDSRPAIEAAPVIDAGPIAEDVPVIEAEPVAEAGSVIDAEPIAEAAPVIEAEPAMETEPIAETVADAEPEAPASIEEPSNMGQ